MEQREIIGRIIAPAGKEATLEHFYFWAPAHEWVEKTQHVVAECAFGDDRVVRIFAVVDEAIYVDMTESVHTDRHRRLNEDPSVEVEGPIEDGTAYYKASILVTDPPVYIAPRSGAPVRLATPEEIAFARGFHRIGIGIPVGLIRNGAQGTAGPAYLDHAFLSGENGAHLNIGGTSGIATKSSAATIVIQSILQVAKRLERENSPYRFLPHAILFNVKGYDLFWIDKPSRPFAENPAHAEAWRKMGLEPKPFERVRFLVPASKGQPETPQPVVNRKDLEAYSWGLGDIIELGLWSHLFSADDLSNQNFSFLMGLWEDRLTDYDAQGNRKLRMKRRLAPDRFNPEHDLPETFEELVAYLKYELDQRDTQRNDGSSRLENAHIATIRAFYRRLKKLQQGNSGLIVWDRPYGSPPRITIGSGSDVDVIDIASLAGSPELQRFVIAAVLSQLVAERTAPDATPSACYYVMLDELNQWAPKGSSDATTKLFEKVAAEMRSLRIILIGCQQFASQVSQKVVENAANRLTGRTGLSELAHELHSYLSATDKQMVSRLQPGEMVLSVPSFRVPAYIKLPFPAWAMRYEEVAHDGGSELTLKNTSLEDDEGPLFDFGSHSASVALE